MEPYPHGYFPDIQDPRDLLVREVFKEPQRDKGLVLWLELQDSRVETRPVRLGKIIFGNPQGSNRLFEQLLASRRLPYISIRLVGGYGVQPVSKILLGPAAEAPNPPGDFEENRGRYVLGDFFVKEPVNAKPEDSVVVPIV